MPTGKSGRQFKPKVKFINQGQMSIYAMIEMNIDVTFMAVQKELKCRDLAEIKKEIPLKHTFALLKQLAFQWKALEVFINLLGKIKH